MQFVDFQSSTIWEEKFVLLKNKLEEIERDGAVGNLVENIRKNLQKKKSCNVRKICYPCSITIHFGFLRILL